MTRFAAEFIAIPPGGEEDGLPGGEPFFHHAGATLPGLHIVVDQAKIISEWHDGAAVLYRESQTLADGSENVRWSTAIFQQAEGKMIWRHLQGNPPRLAQRKRPRLSRGLFERKDLIRGRALRYSAPAPAEFPAGDADLPPGSAAHARG